MAGTMQIVITSMCDRSVEHGRFHDRSVVSSSGALNLQTLLPRSTCDLCRSTPLFTCPNCPSAVSWAVLSQPQMWGEQMMLTSIRDRSLTAARVAIKKTSVASLKPNNPPATTTTPPAYSVNQDGNSQRIFQTRQCGSRKPIR